MQGPLARFRFTSLFFTVAVNIDEESCKSESLGNICVCGLARCFKVKSFCSHRLCHLIQKSFGNIMLGIWEVT